MDMKNVKSNASPCGFSPETRKTDRSRNIYYASSGSESSDESSSSSDSENYCPKNNFWGNSTWYYNVNDEDCSVNSSRNVLHCQPKPVLVPADGKSSDEKANVNYFSDRYPFRMPASSNGKNSVCTANVMKTFDYSDGKESQSDLPVEKSSPNNIKGCVSGIPVVELKWPVTDICKEITITCKGCSNESRSCEQQKPKSKRKTSKISFDVYELKDGNYGMPRPQLAGLFNYGNKSLVNGFKPRQEKFDNQGFDIDLQAVLEEEAQGGGGAAQGWIQGMPVPQPGMPGPQPGMPGPQPGMPGPQPGMPGPQPGMPGPQPGWQGPQPGWQGPQPGWQGPQPGWQGPQPGWQGPQPGWQGLQPGMPGAQPGMPGAQPGMPGAQPGMPGAQPGMPGAQPGMPGAQPGMPGAQPGMPGAQPGMPGAQPGMPGAQPGMPGAQPGMPGAQPGMPGAQPDQLPEIENQMGELHIQAPEQGPNFGNQRFGPRYGHAGPNSFPDVADSCPDTGLYHDQES